MQLRALGFAYIYIYIPPKYDYVIVCIVGKVVMNRDKPIAEIVVFLYFPPDKHEKSQEVLFVFSDLQHISHVFQHLSPAHQWFYGVF